MKSVRIGVVEDEIIVADTIARVLQKLGYTVLEPAITYTEALELLEQQSPDLVLLDINLSGSKDGIDLAWKIKEDYDMPFIFLTSQADTQTIARAKELNPPAYLVKPFNKDDLFASIEIALHNHSGAGQAAPQPVQPSTETPVDDAVEPTVRLRNALFIKNQQTYRKLKFDELLYLKSDHVYVELHTAEKK